MALEAFTSKRVSSWHEPGWIPECDFPIGAAASGFRHHHSRVRSQERAAQWRRALLTVLSVAMSCALLVTLLTLQRELTVPPESEAASFRIIARNKVSLAQPLPARQRTIIEKIPGLRQVSPFTYFGGLFRDETTTSWAQFAVDPARFRELILEGKIIEGSYDAWVKNRNGCMLGADTLRRYGLKVGDKLRFTGTFYPVDLELTIEVVYAGTIDDRNCFFTMPCWTN